MWPFSKEKEDGDTQKVQPSNTIVKSGRGVRIGNFLGLYTESKNTQFLLAWSNSSGEIILADNGKIIFRGELQKPDDGKVSNNGSFVINDWLDGDGCKAIFYAFNNKGEQLIQHRFSANPYNNGISDNGEFAVCQLYNSETDDCATLAFFDLSKRNLLWQIFPESGWADSYNFDMANNELILKYNKGGNYRYNFDGEFLEKNKWDKERIDNASPFELASTAFELSSLARERFHAFKGKWNQEDADEILSLLSEALAIKGLDEYPHEKASVYRLFGEIKERLGKIDDAIKAYENALYLNPKVGVKRRLSVLKSKK